MLNKYIYIENIGVDKYGRILADLMIEGKNVSELLIQSRLAVKYNGGTKNAPEDWMKYHVGC